jgi:cytoskeleton protein RodZ
MNDINQKNENNRQAQDIEPGRINSDIITGSYASPFEHRDYVENTQYDSIANENKWVPEKHDNGAMEAIDLGDHRMNASTDSQVTHNDSNAIDSAFVLQSVGHILRKARMARSMSIEDVSRQLRLSVRQIEAIEKEAFDKLPGRTFLRGFIRNYAHLVQLDPNPLLQMLPESAPVVSTYERTPLKNKQLSFASSREDSGGNRLVSVIVLLMIVVGAYYAYESSDWTKQADQNATTTAAASEVKIDAAKTSVEIQLPLSTSVNNEASSQVNKAPEFNLSANNKSIDARSSATKIEAIELENKSFLEGIDDLANISNDLGNLHFKFTADSWVKVLDGKGVSLLEQVRKGGTEQNLTGKKPLSIVLGNASGVILTYNGSEVDIRSYKKQDGTARFTLE